MEQIRKREEINDIYKWDLSKIYNCEKQLEDDISLINDLTNKFINYEGKLLNSAKDLLEATKLHFSIIRLIDKLSVYSNMLYHQDMSNSKSQILVGRISKLSDEIFEKLAFYSPELLAGDFAKVKEFIKEEKQLETYKFIFEDLFREKEHTLSLVEEQMLARLGEVFSSSEDIYSSLDDVDLTFGSVIDEDNEEVELNGSNYSRLIKSNDRRVRKETFEKFYKSYNSFKNTFASTLNSSVNADLFVAKTRNYNSVLEMSLYSNNIDINLYDKLISKVNDNLDVLHKYVSLKKQMLNLDEMHMYDMYVPLIKDIDKTYSYEDAKELVLKALEPLGSTYIKDLNTVFNSSCIDVYNNKNKRGGAYSWGCYDSDPYVLLNYESTFNDVSTVAHELGHSMHSYYSHKNQEYHNSSYTIFLAEIASTVNEILLNKYAYNHADSKEEKLYYLNNLLESFRTTLYRQTMFAEFEKTIHEKVANMETLTADNLSDTYLSLNKKYYGNDVMVDDEIAYEWARISHFYSSYYVYKYATGIAIACRIVSDILANKENAKENYLEFLKSGGKDYSLNILKNVGIDIVNDDTIDKAIEMFDDTLKEFIKVLNS